MSGEGAEPVVQVDQAGCTVEVEFMEDAGWGLS